MPEPTVSKQQSKAREPLDPLQDQTGSYALDPALVRSLTKHIVSSSRESLMVSSPVNGQPIGVIPQSSSADVMEAFTKAGSAQRQWAETSFEDRAKLMLKFHDLLLERLDECLDLLIWETGKARRHAYEEPLHLALTARYLARSGAKALKSRRFNGVFPFLTHAEVHRVPKGVVGVISPWNYPLAMGLCDGLAAVMAGNAVVAKPDTQTALIMAWGVQLLKEAGFPEDLWQIVAGPGPVTGQQLISQADYVCFTGSTATGQLVAKACAERLIGCSLELGGKNAMIVLDDADLNKATELAVRACFSNAGQLCVGIERLYVAESVSKEFTKLFVKRVEAMNTGSSLEWGIDMGPLISSAQLKRVKAHVKDAVSKGALVLTGGQADSSKGPFFFEPTVLTGVTAQMDLHRKETFGPVVAIETFNDDSEALWLVNDSEYGLNASIATGNASRGRALAKKIRAGNVNINEGYGATFGSIALPMGGMGKSGLGRRQGVEGLLRFTEAQSVATQRLLPLAPAWGLKDDQFAKLMKISTKFLRKIGRS